MSILRNQPPLDVQAEADELTAVEKRRETLQALILAQPDCHQAYQELGVACLRLKDYSAAERYYLEGARRMPDNPGVFDGLAETYGYLGEVAKARQVGRRALVLKDASIPLIVHAPRSVSPRPGGMRLIAFSLFGAHPRYCETAIMNAEVAPGLLPGWQCRYYVDSTVPLEVRDRLRARGAQVILMEGVLHQLPATMWRFLALDAPEADAVICRDADSLLNARDAGWVNAWIASGLPFHIVRDYFSHCELMLAGLFGIRGGALAGVENLMRQWLLRSGPLSRWTDQYFLRTCIWPRARDAALTHDPWYFYGSQVATGTEIVADEHHHVGANHANTIMELNLNHPDGRTVQWFLVDSTGARVSCGYVGQVSNRRYATAIPRSYGERIQSGEWKVQWTVTPTTVDLEADAHASTAPSTR